MIHFDARFRLLAGVLVGINVVGLALIYRAATCRPPGGVRILAALPDRDVDDADRFSLLFDEPLVNPSVVGQPPERTIFRIEPSPDGGWVWASPDRLEYRLSRPLPPGRVFQVRPAADFTAATGHRLVGDREFRFQTRPLRVLETFIKSADREKVTVRVRFNQPVSPTDLLHHLQVRDDGSGDSLEPLCLVREPADELILHVNRPHSDRLRLAIDKDLAGAGAELPLGSSYVTTLKPAKQFRLDRAGVSEYSAFDKEINVWLSFSRRLKPGQLVEGLSITPPVNDPHWELLDERLVVTAAFVPGNRYQITIAAGLLSADGEVLHENTTASVDIRDRWSGLRFPYAQGFLHPSGNLLLDLEATNVSGIVLDVREVLPANLVHALQGHEVEATARVAAERTVPLDLRRNEIRKLTVDLQKLLVVPRGFYRVSAADVDHRWRTTEATICVSDLALTAKEGRDGSVAWVTRLSTAEPVSGCRVTALSYNNQELASAVTDEGGLARLLVPANHAEGRAWLFTAENDDDRTFLVPSEQTWVVDDADQSGRGTPETYDVMLYAERGVYRPGDMIHLTGIIRDAQGHIPATFPLSVKVRRPDGREEAVRAVRTTPGGQGLFHLDYPTSADGQLGEYDFSVSLPGSNETLGGTTAFVEHFLPVRLELKAEPTAESFGPGEKPAVEVAARYLFDKPAAGVPVAVSGTYCLVPYKSARRHGFVFGDERRRTESPVTPINGHLDPEGRLRLALDVPRRPHPSAFREDGAEAEAVLDVSKTSASQTATETAASPEPASSMPGVWEARLTITVTEPGSRSVSRRVQFLADTSGHHVGVRLKDGQVVSAGSAFEVEWVHVGADDQSMTRMFRYRLDRVDRDSSLELVDGRYVWKSIERLTPIVPPADVPTSAEQSEGMFSFIKRLF